MIKLIHLIGSLQIGGAENMIVNQVLKINKKLFEVVVISISQKSNTINETRLENQNIKVIYLGDIIGFNPNDSVFKKAIKRLKRFKLFNTIIEEEKPDIIHSHLQTNNYLKYSLPKKIEIKLFHTMHSEFNVLFNKKRRLEIYATKFLVKKRNMTLIALHNRMSKEANDFFKVNNTIIINNAIDLVKFDSIKIDTNQIKDKLRIPHNSFIIGHVGRFSPVKNHKFIINVFYEVIKRKPNSYLLLIGNGELLNTIKEELDKLNLRDNVIFLQNRQDIPELMSIMDSFVFPSLYEGFGNALLEAQAAKIDCVVSNTIPKEAIVTNFVTSLGLDEPISKWCEAVLTKKSIEKKCINKLEYFGLEYVVKQLEQLYVDSIE